VTRFRPCIDLHDGRVKQIVGGSLTAGNNAPATNFVSERPPEYYSALYRRDGLDGGHVIQLGPGNEAGARAALVAWPGGMQLGGGVTPDNARAWLEAGASKVIVTSYLFEEKRVSIDRLARLAEVVAPEELVIDLSCRRRDDDWYVATDRWRTVTDTSVNAATLELLAGYCSEFLVHAADVEGLCRGIDRELVVHLGEASPLPCTYAGGGRALSDLTEVAELSGGRVDLTFGSALDLFGGQDVRYADCVRYNREHAGDTER
jgi:phosphoribosylformimino-5-aminoimidazole carboxamide ribotide isomerase